MAQEKHKPDVYVVKKQSPYIKRIAHALRRAFSHNDERRGYLLRTMAVFQRRKTSPAGLVQCASKINVLAFNIEANAEHGDVAVNHEGLKAVMGHLGTAWSECIADLVLMGRHDAASNLTHKAVSSAYPDGAFAGVALESHRWVQKMSDSSRKAAQCNLSM